MQFNSPWFLAFFPAFFVLDRFAARSVGQRQWVIIAGSLVFYGAWNPRFVPVLLGFGLLNHFMALELFRENDESRRKRRVAIGVAVNLAGLGVLKNWGIPSANSTALARVLIPVGISFYTLQCISYQVDIYRRAIEPCRRLRDFLAALTFFPKLTAGPFVRWAEWLPQFEERKSLEWRDVERAFLLIAAGLVKMTAAELLAPAVNELFSTPEPHTALASWTGVLAFAGQLYGDFAGYTDVATGCALLLGFSLPRNFDLPYLASSPIEFWRRWQISFFRWLYEFVYLPLVLRYRKNPYACVMATVLLAGLWHGARSTFLCYGVYNAVLLAATHWLAVPLPEHEPSPWIRRLSRVVATPAAFYFLLMGLVIFNSRTLSQAWTLWLDMHKVAFSYPAASVDLMALAGAAGAIVLCHALDYAVRESKIMKNPMILWPAVVLGFLSCFVLGQPDKTFFYFQF